MNQTMGNKGWIFTETGRPLELVEVAEPVPGPGEVAIDVVRAGLCHSDIGIIEGPGAGWIKQRPIVLGHEVAGVIRELGPGVEGFAVGDRVVIALIAHGEGVSGNWIAPGLSRNGGFEQRCIAEVRELVRLPDGVGFAHGAVATDAVTTAWHAVICEGQVREGTTVGIIGLGGLGLSAVQIARHAGATVHGADISARARDQAARLGATSVHAEAMDLAAFKPDVVFDFAGFGETTAAAVNVAAQGGRRAILIGLGATRATISTDVLVNRQVTLKGSAGGSRKDLEACLALIAQGAITLPIEELPFDRLDEGMRRLAAGDLVGRLVLAVDPARS
ncbi:zinc-binding dehydrogenase [Novosphingobium bradum]|uniref:alcohol dehydrogenase n=1 Tax=Novosphingobium bradum TaxID=1737444 RepID=A0ABV7IMD7_9SPHN